MSQLDPDNWRDLPPAADREAEPDVVPGSQENIAELKRLLRGWRCCGAPDMCGARCQDDPLSAALALAERALRDAH
jgi:hypothetical protein